MVMRSQDSRHHRSYAYIEYWNRSAAYVIWTIQVTHAYRYGDDLWSVIAVSSVNTIHERLYTVTRQNMDTGAGRTMMSPMWNEQDTRWHCAVSYDLHTAIQIWLIRPISGPLRFTRGILWPIYGLLCSTRGIWWPTRGLLCCMWHIMANIWPIMFYMWHNMANIWPVVCTRRILWPTYGLLCYTCGI